jgi:hypothetical protein
MHNCNNFVTTFTVTLLAAVVKDNVPTQYPWGPKIYQASLTDH